MDDLRFGLEGSRLTRGAIGGLAGGLVFGLMMQMMGMIPMIAMLVGSTSVAVGWLVHLLISLAVGLAFAAVVATDDRLHAVGWGIAAALGMWVAGGMIVMRLALGAPIALDSMAIGSLVGHVVYGAILGFTYAALARTAYPPPVGGRLRGPMGGR